MRKDEEHVGRADHNPEGARNAATGAEGQDKSVPADAADKRGHGAHGKSADSEQVDDKPPVEPDAAKGTDRGSAAWGSAASGGSVIDTRPKQ